MDYHDSSAGTANLAVIKYTTVESGKSKGSIFINPGLHPCSALRMVVLTCLLRWSWWARNRRSPLACPIIECNL